MGVEIVSTDGEIESISVPAMWLVPAVLVGFAALYLLVALGRNR